MSARYFSGHIFLGFLWYLATLIYSHLPGIISEAALPFCKSCAHLKSVVDRYLHCWSLSALATCQGERAPLPTFLWPSCDTYASPWMLPHSTPNLWHFIYPNHSQRSILHLTLLFFANKNHWTLIITFRGAPPPHDAHLHRPPLSQLNGLFHDRMLGYLALWLILVIHMCNLLVHRCW